MEKTNINFLRNILNEIAEVCPTLAGEAEEFLDAIENEDCDCEKENDKIERLDERIIELEQQNEELEDKFNDHSAFVGLDSIYWGLEKGNLVIQMRMEAFIKQLQRENAVVPV